MASNKTASASWMANFFQAGLYKRNQGRVARQVTFAAGAVIVALGCYSLSQQWSDKVNSLQYGVPALLLGAGWWICYRIVNMSSFADFLIAVEGEMAKVSWPSRQELIRSSIVVIVTILFFAVLLFGYDLLWQQLLSLIGVLELGGG